MMIVTILCDLRKLIFLPLLVLLVSACHVGAPPVTDRSVSSRDFDQKGNRIVRPNRPLNVGEYLIKPGDTLYSIAWGAGLRFQDVAKWNNISAPYLIKSGEIITLKKPDGFVEVPEVVTVAQEQPIIATDIDDTTNTTTSTRPTTPVDSTGSIARATTTAPQSSVPKPSVMAKTALRNPTRWQRPLEGPLLSSFSPSEGRSGVQISGKRGVPVKSTAEGDVVYVGDGLRGYGNLVIIKHSNEYLSAYAHNDSILVAEGNRVKAGQHIALVGDSGTDRTMLHFEIRKDGKPVNPMNYLNN